MSRICFRRTMLSSSFSLISLERRSFAVFSFCNRDSGILSSRHKYFNTFNSRRCVWCSWRKFEKYPLYLLNQFSTRTPRLTSFEGLLRSHTVCSSIVPLQRKLYVEFDFCTVFKGFASCTAWPLLFVPPRLMHILLSFELDWYILFTTASFHYCSVLQANSFWSHTPSFLAWLVCIFH